MENIESPCLRTEWKSGGQCFLKCEEDQPAAEALAHGSLHSQGNRGELDGEMASIMMKGGRRKNKKRREKSQCQIP